MITLLTGAPGAGKTAALVDMLLDWVEKGRKVYVDGIPDLAMLHEPLADARKWHEPGVVEDGSIIVIDEVQRHWRVAPAGSKVPPDIDGLETHRHRGLDFYIVTQEPGLVHSNVRKLVGRHVHLRDLGVLGRRWYEWPECQPSPGQKFKSAPVQRGYKVPKRVIGAYKSASIHIKPIRSIPRSLILLLCMVPLIGFLAWKVYDGITSKLKPSIPAAAGGASAAARSPAGGPFSRPAAASAAQAAPVVLEVSAPVKNREPFAGYRVTLAASWSSGQVRRSWFGLHLADGQRVGLLSDKEVLDAGYSWRQFAPCSGVLIFGELERVVRCDAPVQQPGQAQRPAVPAAAPQQPQT